MPENITIRLKPAQASDEKHIRRAIKSHLNLKGEDFKYLLIKRSIDARRSPVILLQIDVFKGEERVPLIPSICASYRDVSKAEELHIIGAGPAGLFAALKCLEVGLRPIIHERGKDVRSRRRDIAKLNKEHVVDPDSNYCFGEGGAGAYSDGKLYTRSKKRGDVDYILRILIEHGAATDITVDSHPHIGTNKLPDIIAHIRETIETHGGEVRFGSKLKDIIIEEDQVQSIVVNEEIIECSNLILATGHSARDIFYLLNAIGVEIEKKPFALGVRVEHPQALIDSIQYGMKERGEHLPPAAYNLVCQVKESGVYSFCMCPGGIIAPCATSPGEIVTNGWSPSKRNNPFANSGMVVEVTEEDLKPYTEHGALAGLEFQKEVEQRACAVAGGTQAAPAQRLMDFIEGVKSKDLPDCSYHPGIVSVNLVEVLPSRIYRCLQEGFKEFGKKMKGFLTNDAVVVATESRTSSPVKVPRDKVSLEHIRVRGLFPCGEGAGYAGGIISAAIDGQRCAEKVVEGMRDSVKS